MSDHFTDIIWSLHDGMNTWVVDAGFASGTFPEMNGTKQGCVLTPLLFAILFTAMLQVGTG